MQAIKKTICGTGCHTLRSGLPSTVVQTRSFGDSGKVNLKDTPLYTSKTGSVDDCDTVITGFTDIYGRLLGKRFDKDYFKKSGMYFILV